MFLFLLALCLAALYRVKITSWNEDYLGIQETTAVKGFFTGLVFLSHMRTYLDPTWGGRLDSCALWVISHFGQLMVAYFFFCSGYGILLSCRTKKDYDKTFLKHRLLKTLAHFDMAIILYLVLAYCIGKQYDLKHLLFCWIGWESIGNSNWFVFVTLALYALTWIGFSIKRRLGDDNRFLVAIVFVLCIGLWIGLYFTKKSYWYNTLFCYPLGMSVALFKGSIDRVCSKTLGFCLSAGIALLLFVLTYFAKNKIACSICAMVFCILVMLSSIKIKVRSPVLIWIGRHLFEIYILQRSSMIILYHIGVDNHYIFGIISIAVTALLVVLFRNAEQRIDKLFAL